MIRLPLCDDEIALHINPFPAWVWALGDSASMQAYERFSCGCYSLNSQKSLIILNIFLNIYSRESRFLGTNMALWHQSYIMNCYQQSPWYTGLQPLPAFPCKSRPLISGRLRDGAPTGGRRLIGGVSARRWRQARATSP